MADIKSPEERSRNMSRIRSKDTKPEEYVRKELFRHGYRYRKNVNTIPGHPDIWLPKYNTAIFVHGCFWHRHEGCKYSYMPQSHVEFWKDKFKRNVERDRVVRNELREAGIKMLVIWECTVRKMKKSQETKDIIFNSCEQFIKDNHIFIEL